MAAVSIDEENRRWLSEEYAELGLQPLIVERCISADYFELERDKIFRHAWTFAGREAEIPEPGDFLVKEIPALKAHVLIIRGQDGVVRGFHNVCRHRGNMLVWDECGQRKALTCRFHGWTWDTQGKLRGVPDQAMFTNFDREQHGLVPVAVETWCGFMYLNLEPRRSLREHLGELTELMEGYPFERIAATEYRWRGEVRCNWKIAIDAFQEAYHAGSLHQLTTGRTARSKTNPYAHLMDVRLYEKNRHATAPGSSEYQMTPVQQAIYELNPTVTRFRTSRADGSDGRTVWREIPGTNPGRVANWGFDINVIFPAQTMNIFGGFFNTTLYYPVSVDRTMFELRLYMPKAGSTAERLAQEYTRCLLYDTIMEDTSTLEHTHAALESHAIKELPLQEQEVLIRHHHKVVHDVVTDRLSM